MGKKEILEAIRQVAQQLGHAPSKRVFLEHSGMTEYRVLQHFPSWGEAGRVAGLEPDSTNIKLGDDELLQDWGSLVRALRQIPTRNQYRNQGNYNPGPFERAFGAWSVVPVKFRQFAEGKSEWVDVLALLPATEPRHPIRDSSLPLDVSSSSSSRPRHSKLEDRSTYGNPIDFRGLRHEPVNEQGVVFLFGMVARELGYLVEAVQAGFPDCEAKRHIGANKWQRVRIEFEFESRNFRDHKHPADGCDVIVCWSHNWPDCLGHLEIVELRSITTSLAKSEE